MNAAYLSFAAAVALLIASPGPVVALVVADAKRSWPGWTIAGGVLSAQVLMISALVVIYLTVDINPAMLDWGQVAGGMYLAWLGFKTLTGSSEPVGGPPPNSHRFWRAMGVGLSNPKDILFFLAFLPGFIFPTEPFAPQAATLIAIWAAVDISILLLYGLLSRKMSGIPRAQRLQDVAPGLFLLALGVFSFTMGLGGIVS